MLEEFIAGKCLEIAAGELDAATLKVLKRNLMDSYAGICAALADHEMIAKFGKYAALCPDDNGVSVWGAGVKAQPVHAVFMNGILGRRADLVNSYLAPNDMGGNHPSDNVSLLLTLADWRGLDGAALLKAMHLVYLMSCAFSDYYDPEDTGYDHDAAAIFYTALCAGHILGLDREGMVQVQRMAGAMGLDVNQAGVGQITDWKHCTYASCAMRGLSAAMMARAGMQGPVDIYQGQAGTDRFLTHADTFWAKAPDLNGIVFKQWQALVFCQTPIDVAITLSPQLKQTGPDQVDKVDVYTYAMTLKEAGTPDSYRPDTRAGRTHSLPYCVACALLDGTIGYDSYDDQTAGEKALQDLMAKVVLHEDTQMTAAYPAKSPCRIDITCQDGQTLSARLDYPHGDPCDPMSDDEVADKARQYLSPLVASGQADGVVERLWDIEKQDKLDWLLDPLKQDVIHV